MTRRLGSWRYRAAFAWAVLLLGCAPAEPWQLPENHPASPDAAPDVPLRLPNPFLEQEAPGVGEEGGGGDHG